MGPSLSHRCVQNLSFPPLSSYLKPTPKVKEHELQQLSQWVHCLAPWSVFFTGTFEGEYSEASCQRAFERYAKKTLPGVSYFYSIESNPSRAGHHVHALLADCAGMKRTEMWEAWFKRFGRARVEPVRSIADVSEYCSKHLTSYLTKARGWWNFHLGSPDLWHRQAKAS